MRRRLKILKPCKKHRGNWKNAICLLRRHGVTVSLIGQTSLDATFLVRSKKQSHAMVNEIQDLLHRHHFRKLPMVVLA